MSEENYLQNRRWQRFPPSISDIQEVITNLDRRMRMLEFEFVKDVPLEDVVKALLIQGHPIAYLRRELEENFRTKQEGLIFKHPKTESRRIIREIKLLNRIGEFL